MKTSPLPCHPRCDANLPGLGSARVYPEYNMCQSSPELILRIVHEIRSVSTFHPNGNTIDTRRIGTEHWPLQLEVLFSQRNEDDFYLKACVVTQRTSEVACFINSTLHRSEFGCADRTNNTTPIFLLSLLLAVFFLSLAVGLVLLAHRLYVRFYSNRHKRQRKFTKQSTVTSLLPSLPSQKFSLPIEEDRLTVIVEVDEKELPSRSGSSSGFEGSGMRSGSHTPEPEISVPSLFPPHLRTVETTLTANNNKITTEVRPVGSTFRPSVNHV